MNRSIETKRAGLDAGLQQRWMHVAGLGVLCTLLGCTAISDLGRFDSVEDAGSNAGRGGKGGSSGKGGGGEADSGNGSGSACGGNPRNLCLRLRGYTPHLDELVRVDLVTNKDNVLRSRAILDPLSKPDGDQSGDADIVLPMAVPENEVPDDGDDSPLHLEIFADQNKNGEYTPMEDHDWNVDLPADGRLIYPHNSDFSSLEPLPREQGADFTMHFTGMTGHIGVRLEIMVIQAIDGVPGRTVGLYRLAAVREDTFDVVIPGIIDPGNISYLVEFYADANDNGRYDDPPVDHAWTRSGESADKGFELTFNHGTEFMNLKFQLEFE